MASFAGQRANRPPATGGQAQEKHTLASNVWVEGSTIAATDTLYIGKLPKGAVITGGRVYSSRLSSGTTSASCCFSMALGVDQIVKNESGTSFTVASLTSALGNYTQIDFRQVGTSDTTGVSAALTTRRWDSGFDAPLGGLLLTQGPLTMQADGFVFATIVCVGLSTSAISGNLNLELDYLVGAYA